MQTRWWEGIETAYYNRRGAEKNHFQLVMARFGESVFKLEKKTVLEDNPPMVTLKADNRSRVKLPDVKPGQVFAYETSGNVVKLTPVKPVVEDMPVVKPVKGPNGLYRLPEGVKLSREEISAAIRADRDAQ
jgi:hypothetical protein